MQNHIYNELVNRDHQLKNDIKSLILKTLHENGGRVTFTPSSNESDYPVTSTLYGKNDSPNINITDVYLGEGDSIYADGVDNVVGGKETDFLIYPEQYSDMMFFLAWVLDWESARSASNTPVNEKLTLFDQRRDLLREDLTQAIINLFKEHNISELRLTQNEEHQTFVVWFDKRCYGYDSKVTKVMLIEDEIHLEIYDETCCCSETLSGKNGDFACENIDWLASIYDNMIFTLSLHLSQGAQTILDKLIEWNFDDRGLSEELSDEEVKEITAELQAGKTEGELLRVDGDFEFEGKWQVINQTTTEQ